MTGKRCKFELVKGGWIGDDKVQNETIVCYDNLKKIKYLFTLKCIGKYEEYNEKELERLVNLLNQLLSENKLLKDTKNISDGMRLLE